MAYVLSNSSYLPFLPVGPAVSCCCGMKYDGFGKLCINMLRDSLMGFCNADSCCLSRANSNFASNFARNALRRVIPALGSWFVSADSDLAVIVLVVRVVLLFS